MTGERPRADQLREHLDAVRAALSGPGDDIGHLTIAHGFPPPNAAERKEIASIFAQTQRVRAHAVVIDSMLARAVLTGIQWLGTTPLRFDERLFSEPSAAFAWLAEVVPAINPNIVAYEIRTTVPKAHHWPGWDQPTKRE